MTDMTVRALLKHHHMGDYTVHRFLAEMLTEMKADGAIVDFEFLAASRTEWMALGVYSVDLYGVVKPTMTWAQGKEAVEEYMTGLFRDEMLVEGLYGLADVDTTDTDPVPAAGVDTRTFDLSTSVSGAPTEVTFEPTPDPDALYSTILQACQDYGMTTDATEDLIREVIGSLNTML